MLTSVCGFASLLPPVFPVLRNSACTRSADWSRRAGDPPCVARAATERIRHPRCDAVRRPRRRLLRPVRRLRGIVTAALGLALAAMALAVLLRHQDTLWNRELAALSPVSAEDQNYDAELRGDLGAADVRDLVIISGPTLESALRLAEHAAQVLRALVDANVIGGFDSPANYLPVLRPRRHAATVYPARRSCATTCDKPSPTQG